MTVQLTKEQIERMIEKADDIEKAIESKDRVALHDAIDIPCQFCITFSDIENENYCGECPLSKEANCEQSFAHTSYGDIVWFMNDRGPLSAALEGINNIRIAIEAYAKSLEASQ